MTEAVEPELPRGIALAWGVAANPQRGPKREMSVEKIVDAAIELADAEGLGAVSMAGAGPTRRVGVGIMRGILPCMSETVYVRNCL